MSERYEKLRERARAVGAAARLARMQAARMAAAEELTGDEMLRVSDLFEAWTPGTYASGDVRRHGEQLWRCVQGHDSAENENWEPGQVPALWTVLHGCSAGTARPWTSPGGAQDAYARGEYMRWSDGKVYRCLQDGTVHGPDVLPQAWEAAE